MTINQETVESVDVTSDDSFPASDAPAWGPVSGVGPPHHKLERVVERSPQHRGRADRDALLSAIEKLESAARESTGHEGRRSIMAELRSVQAALNKHIAFADVADGLYSEVDMKRPSLVRAIGKIRREHDDLARQTNTLLERLEQGAEDGEIHTQIQFLLAFFKRHQDEESDLMFESFNMDFGAAD